MKRIGTKIKIILFICVYFMYVGCSNTQTTICPTFPKPNQTTLNKIKELHDKDVDNWMIELIKLKDKLKECSNV